MRVFSILTCTLGFFGLVCADRSSNEGKEGIPLGLSPVAEVGFRATRAAVNMLGVGSVGWLRFLVNTNNMGTTIASVASEGATGMGKQAVNTMTAMGELALSGGLTLTDQAMDLAASVVEPVPVVGSAAAAGTNLGKITTDQLEKVGFAVIDYFQKTGINGLDMINKSVKEDTRYVADLVEAGADKVESGLTKGFNAVHSGLNKGEKITLSVTDAIDSRVGLKPPTKV